jgi:hypothetical protein
MAIAAIAMGVTAFLLTAHWSQLRAMDMQAGNLGLMEHRTPLLIIKGPQRATGKESRNAEGTKQAR